MSSIDSLMRKGRPYILVAPLVIFLSLTFLWALWQGVLQSLGSQLGEFTLRHYREAVLASEFSRALAYTFFLALASSLLSTLIGVALAYSLLNRKVIPKWQHLLMQIPIIMPHMVVVVIIFHFFSQTGVVARIAYQLGFIDHPNAFPLMVFDRLGVGIILVYLFKQIPFIATIAHSTLANISDSFTQVALNLGATKKQVNFQILLPLLAPTIFSLFVITFTFAFGAFEVPFLIGSPAQQTLPVKALVYYMNPDLAARATAMVLNVLLSALSLVFALIYTLGLARLRHTTFEGK